MSEKSSKKTSGSMWGGYVQSKSGTADEIRKSVQEIKSRVDNDRKIFTKAAMINGGVWIRQK